MPLSQDHVSKLRTIWFDLTGELLTMDETWNMATRLIVFFDVLTKRPSSPVDNSILTDSSPNGINDIGDPPLF